MKKSLLLISMLALTLGASAQKNLFDAADVDAEGWLWFDTAEKIEKYVGVCNEEDYCLDPNGKPIQLVYADQMPDYPAAVADAEMYGIGSDGYQYGEIPEDGGLPMGLDAVKGAIKIPAATANQTYNGGGIAVMMPSCVEFGLKLSCEAKMYMRFHACKENNAKFSDVNIGETYVPSKWANVKVYSLFGAISAGQRTITGIETLNNGYAEFDNGKPFTLKSDEPRNFYLCSGRTYPIYVHAIRVIVNGNADGISEVHSSNVAQTKNNYNLMGQRVGANSRGIVVMNGKKVIK